MTPRSTPSIPVGPRTEAGKALVEWAENAYPGQDQVRIWREHAVAIEAEASAEARPTPVEPEALCLACEYWPPDCDEHAPKPDHVHRCSDCDRTFLEVWRDFPQFRRLAVEPDGLPLDVPRQRMQEALHDEQRYAGALSDALLALGHHPFGYHEAPTSYDADSPRACSLAQCLDALTARLGAPSEDEQPR